MYTTFFFHMDNFHYGQLINHLFIIFQTVARRITLLPIAAENFAVKLTKNSKVVIIALQKKFPLAHVMESKSVHIRVDALTTKTVARRITLLPISAENFVVKLTKNSNVALIALQVKSTLANVMDLDLAGRVVAARIMITKSVHIRMDALTIDSRFYNK